MGLIRKFLSWLFDERTLHCKRHDMDYMEHGFYGAYDCPECRREDYIQMRAEMESNDIKAIERAKKEFDSASRK